MSSNLHSELILKESDQNLRRRAIGSQGFLHSLRPKSPFDPWTAALETPFTPESRGDTLSHAYTRAMSMSFSEAIQAISMPTQL